MDHSKEFLLSSSVIDLNRNQSSAFISPTILHKYCTYSFNGSVAFDNNWKTPENVHEVRSFVGLATYFRRFILLFCRMAAPLTNLTKKDLPFSWNENCQKAFEQIKHALMHAPVLALPDFLLPFVVECDASFEGIGAVLMQNGRPLAYESRRLIPAEVKITLLESKNSLLWSMRAKHGDAT